MVKKREGSGEKSQLHTETRGPRQVGVKKNQSGKKPDTPPRHFWKNPYTVGGCKMEYNEWWGTCG